MPARRSAEHGGRPVRRRAVGAPFPTCRSRRRGGCRTRACARTSSSASSRTRDCRELWRGRWTLGALVDVPRGAQDGAARALDGRLPRARSPGRAGQVAGARRAARALRGGLHGDAGAADDAGPTRQRAHAPARPPQGAARRRRRAGAARADRGAPARAPAAGRAADAARAPRAPARRDATCSPRPTSRRGWRSSGYGTARDSHPHQVAKQQIRYSAAANQDHAALSGSKTRSGRAQHRRPLRGGGRSGGSISPSLGGGGWRRRYPGSFRAWRSETARKGFSGREGREEARRAGCEDDLVAGSAGGAAAESLPADPSDDVAFAAGNAWRRVLLGGVVGRPAGPLRCGDRRHRRPRLAREIERYQVFAAGTEPAALPA